MSFSGEGERPNFRSELAGLLLSEETVSGLLDLVVTLATTALDDIDGASVSLLVRNNQRFETANATSELIREIDESQYRASEGPCVEAIKTGAEVHIPIPIDRWDDFVQRAEKAGVRSVLSLPLQIQGQSTGGLNLYSMTASSFEASTVESARALAGQAAVVLANAAALTSAELSNQHLQQALASRDLIGQAKGILMAREGISDDEAFASLRQLSQRSGRKLRDVAAAVVSGLAPRRDQT
ncbi:MAG: ANTAR domain-containing protein [Acidimicrobiales bacterium]